MSGGGGDENFLGRWSRLKRAPEADAAAPDPAPAAEPPAETAPVGDDENDARSDEEILAELGLPHPESLRPGDDVRGFMQAAVPERLRHMALRRLWRSNPVLANLDQLVEYGEDYTDAATVIENMQTVYQVGKGMLRDLVEEDEAAEGGAADVDEADSEGGVDEDPSPEEDAAAVAEAPEDAPAGDAPAEDAPEPPAAAEEEIAAADGDPVAPTRRRMAFSYEN